MNPKISVLMSVLNGEEHLRASIESILAQTLNDFEFIIVDDASIDGSWDIMQEYSNEDPRIRLLRNDKNLKLPVSLNKGLSLAKGLYLARHDADDVSYPERLEKQAGFLDQHPDILAVGSQMLVVNSGGRPLRLWKVPLDHESIDFRYINGFGGVIPHPTLMVRTQTIHELGGYNEEFTVAQDRDLFLRLAEAGRLANLPDVLVKYRDHGHNVTILQRNKTKASGKYAVEKAWERRGLGTPPFESIPNPRIKFREGSRAVSLFFYGLKNILKAPTSREGWAALEGALLRFAGKRKK